ncbi:MAG: TIGR04190 family B12-binding domain/radical SAM domain protein, partial [Actinomycetota bacterium]|nr:TIGR04190 family B12-binding domain/radical SAM domain protein [Actinomycetota bacterium]
MPEIDLILLHAPSVYDFREKTIMYGPLSDLIPSAPIFEMYPMGFSIMAEYLDRFGHKARVVNLAVLMLKSKNFDVEKRIRSLKARAFGIDLHWLPHAHGSIEVAKLVKKHHPDRPIIFGGYSSSYFHKELMEYPFIDYVIRGDSTEEPLRQLLKIIKEGGDLRSVPNLTYRDGARRVCENPLTHVPKDINHINMDYSFMMKSAIRYRDLVGCLPWKDWLKHPSTAVITCKGCTKNCSFCGASAFAQKNFYGRSEVAYRDPELVARDILSIQGCLNSPTFVLGDLLQSGEDYARRFFAEARRLNLKNQVGLEFFSPPGEDFFKMAGGSLNHYAIGASLESHDMVVRRGSGKTFDNEELEASIGWALANGAERFEIYYMTGLPFQTADSARDTVNYADYLYSKFDGDKRLLAFISPLVPFIDPGSLIYENPEKYGYKIKFKTLNDHRRALLAPSWKYVLNYETDYMTADDYVSATYDAMSGINRVKLKYGVIGEAEARLFDERVAFERELIGKIDEIMALGDEELKSRRLAQLKEDADRYSVSESASSHA